MRYIICLSMAISTQSFADGQAEALSKISEAMLKTKTGVEVEKNLKKLESKLTRKLPIGKKLISTFSSVIAIIANKRIDTKAIGKMNVNVLGVKVRPNIEYDLENGNINGSLIAKWGWN